MEKKMRKYRETKLKQLRVEWMRINSYLKEGFIISENEIKAYSARQSIIARQIRNVREALR